ncbi:hypothetical protein LguiA_030483 [Lonicera macranthoides]
MIYPIFYDVEPNEVQHPESGSYKDAFLEHKKDEKLNEEIVQQWMKALETIGDLKGWELKKVTNSKLYGSAMEVGGTTCDFGSPLISFIYDKHEGELVKVIVENILLELKKNYTHEPQNLIGMDNRIEELKRLLKVDSNGVRIVGIHGIDDVQDNTKQDKDIVNLQNQLLSKIQKREVPKLDDFHQGRDKIRDTVREKKVLLVLDNVDRYFQINMLVGDHNWFGDQSSSLFIEEDIDMWEEILRNLEKVAHGEVIQKLRFSYEALTYEQKQIFLDIALLFNGHNKREPCYMWDSCGFCPTQGINVLIRRSLLTIGYDDTLIMHNSLRDLGKQIVHEEGLSVLGMRSRLQDDEALPVLKAYQVIF